ncbi:unnamed protein product [Linum trigynum]|uniref:DUF1918 domain-containing protein n=1 Tax=Linum trigynum TaxID=586398 RepID=A0AAV2E0L4_9ROSI
MPAIDNGDDDGSHNEAIGREGRWRSKGIEVGQRLTVIEQRGRPMPTTMVTGDKTRFCIFWLSFEHDGMEKVAAASPGSRRRRCQRGKGI